MQLLLLLSWGEREEVLLVAVRDAPRLLRGRAGACASSCRAHRNTSYLAAGFCEAAASESCKAPWHQGTRGV